MVERPEYGRTLEEARDAAERWRLIAAENEAEFRSLGLENQRLRKALQEVLDVGDRAAVLVAGQALASNGERDGPGN